MLAWAHGAPISSAMPYGDIALPLIFGPVLIAALASTVRAALSWLRLRGEAEEDYGYRAQNGMVPAGVDREAYLSTYCRVNAPRLAAHAAAALWAVLIATPVIAMVLEFLLEQLWQATGQSRVFEPGYLVWAFFIFFGLMGAWAAIAWVVARHYHRHAPPRFEDALRDAA